MSMSSTLRFSVWLRCVIAAALFFPLLCAAAPSYSFQFVLTVDHIDRPCNAGSIAPSFGCSVSVGDQWQGDFALGVDPTTLPDGPLSTPFLSMHLDTGNQHWDHCVLAGPCVPAPGHVVAGYRDVVGPTYINSDGPGFYVSSGKLSGFSGGFFALSDATFLDFDYYFSPGAGLFAATDIAGQSVSGTYRISSADATVPAPGTLSLVCTAMLALLWVRRLGVKPATRLQLQST